MVIKCIINFFIINWIPKIQEKLNTLCPNFEQKIPYTWKKKVQDTVYPKPLARPDFQTQQFHPACPVSQSTYILGSGRTRSIRPAKIPKIWTGDFCWMESALCVPFTDFSSLLPVPYLSRPFKRPSLPRLPQMEFVTNGMRSSWTEIPKRNFRNLFV